MQLQEACEKLWEIEQGHDVNQYKVNGAHIWPIARTVLWRLLTEYNADGLPPLVLNDPRQRFRKIVKYVASPLWNMCQKFRISRSCGNYVDVLFLSPAQYYTETVEGKRFSRILDPVYEELGKKFSTVKFSISPKGFEKKNPSLNLRFPSNPAKVNVEAEKTIREFSAILSARLPLDLDYLCWEIEQAFVEIFFYRESFSPILSENLPKVLIQTCYYALPHMGLLWAASKLGIPSVDVQHGKQGKFQGMYSHWSRIPEEGYAVLPTEFWSWGEQSVEHIMRWQPDRSTHRAVAVGYPWLEKSKVLLGNKPRPQGWPTGKKVVLVTLQARMDSNGLIPEFLVQIINELDGFFWLLRPHFNAPESKEIALQISAGLSPGKVNVSDAQLYSVYQLLMWSDLHLTSFSSVCYEGVFFNVPTGIFSNIGLKMYQDEIKKGVFIPVTNKQQLNEFLLNPNLHKHEYFLSNSDRQIVTEFLRLKNC